MGIYSHSQSGVPTYTIIVGISVAVLLALLGLPGVDLLLRLVAALGLAALAVLNLIVLRGSPARFKYWRIERRQQRALNRGSGLIPDLAKMVQSTKDLLYENRPGTLTNLVRAIGEQSSSGAREQLQGRASVLLYHFRIFDDMTETNSRWDKTPFVAFLRALGRHFGELSSLLATCYEVAKGTQIDDSVIMTWAVFKENYNQLRSNWEAYFARVPKAVGLHIELGGSPAVALPQFRPDAE